MGYMHVGAQKLDMTDLSSNAPRRKQIEDLCYQVPDGLLQVGPWRRHANPVE